MGLLHGGLLQASGRAEVVAFVDAARPARLIAKGMGIKASAYASLDEAVDRHPDLDACFVCTPPRSHMALAQRALDIGLHTFVEKPLTVSAPASQALADKSAAKGLVGLVGYVRRHHPAFAHMQGLAQARGTPERIEVSIRSPQFVHAQAGEGAARGGLEWDLLPHVVDAAFWIAGARERGVRVEGVSCFTTDRIVARGLAGRTTLDIEADWASRDVRKVELSVTAHYEDGNRLGCNEDHVWTATAGSNPQLVFHRREHPAPWFDVAGAEFSGQIMDVVSAFQGKPSRSATFSEAARVDAFIAACIARAGGAPG